MATPQTEPLATLIALDERVIVVCPHCKQKCLPLPVEPMFDMALASALIGCKLKSLPAMLLKEGFERHYRLEGRNKQRRRVVLGSEIAVLRKKFTKNAPAEAVPIAQVRARAKARREKNAQFRLAGRNTTSR